ncbi:MAG: molybdopterin molybdotransferase MoeA [Bacillota bacterium]
MLYDIEVEQARREMLRHASPLPPERVPLLESLDRIACEDILCPVDRPGSAQAAMDGFAVHYDDLPGQNYVKIQKDLAGNEYIMSKGSSVPVATGDSLPEGAAAVIPHERVKVAGDFFLPPRLEPGSNIRQPGEDFTSGDVIVSAGSPVTPGVIAVLAAYGIKSLAVHRKARVAILSLSPDVAPYYALPARGQARDCNGPLLAALIMRDRGQVTALETCGQHGVYHFTQQCQSLLADNDLLITIGMAYSGDLRAMDLLQKAGANPLFRETRIQPGGHNGGAILKGKPVISLSGNPAACAVGYEVLAAPLIRKLQGGPADIVTVDAVCINDYPLSTNRSRRFLRGRLVYRHDRWEVLVLPGQKPSMLRSLLACNALIDLPAGHAPVTAGANLSVMALHNFSLT